MLHRLVEIIQPVAASLGGVGLALVALLDSSFLAFPSVPDLLLVWLVAQHPDRWGYYAAMTAVGSIIGSYVIYAIARRGGQAVLQRKFRTRTFKRGLEMVRRYGLLAVVVPSIMPPPTPFKLFVILAGLSGIGRGSFLGAVVLGRAFRYGLEAYLAYRYGDEAMRFITANVASVSIGAAAVILVFGLAYIVWGRRRAA